MTCAHAVRLAACAALCAAPGCAPRARAAPAAQTPRREAAAAAPRRERARRLELARAALARGEGVRAERALRPLLPPSATDAFARYQLGVALHQQRRFAEAADELARAADELPPDAVRWRARALWGLAASADLAGDCPRAASAFRRYGELARGFGDAAVRLERAREVERACAGRRVAAARPPASE